MDLTGTSAAPHSSNAATDPAGPTGRLATWLAGVTLADVPPPVREHAKHLVLQLRRRGVTQIVLAGISTSMGVESTARSAWENSYNLIFAEDAITDVDAASHTHTFTKIFPHLCDRATKHTTCQR
jgi:nicotinamidase-related amidase